MGSRTLLSDQNPERTSPLSLVTNVAAAYPSLAESLKSGHTASALWINHKRQEQMLTSYAPLHSDNGAVIGALVVGTPLNDERLTRTSDLTSGHVLMLEAVSAIEGQAPTATPFAMT